MITYNYYSRFWEYLLLVSPPEEIKKSIGKVKKEITVKYGCPAGCTPNITLASFALAKGYERNMLAHLFAFFINRIAFEIRLNCFGVFPSHTLYAGVQYNESLKRLQNGLLLELTGSLSVREKHIRTAKTHCMTVAGNLNAAQFSSVSDEYRNRKINTSFLAKNIVLLKRPYEEYKLTGSKWQGSHNFVIGY